MRACILIILSAYLLPGSVNAADRPAGSTARFELTPYFSQRAGGTFKDQDTGEKFDLDSSGSYGLILGIPWEYNSQLEIYYNRQATDVDTAGFVSSGAKVPLDLDTLQLGGSVFFEPRGSAVPFFSATLGGTRIRPDVAGGRADTFWSFAAGGGLRFAPSSRVGVRLEARLNGILVNSSSSIFCGSGPQGGGCLINTSGDVLWQAEALAGISFRF